MLLSELEIGNAAVVTEVGGEGALRRHFLDMGLIPGVVVTIVKYAPMGDPVEIMLRGYELTIRRKKEISYEEMKKLAEKAVQCSTSEEVLDLIHSTVSF